MSALAPFTVGDWTSIRSEILLASCGVGLLLLSRVFPRLSTKLLSLIAAITVLGALFLTMASPPAGVMRSFNGLLECSPLTLVASCIVLLVACLALLSAPSWLDREQVQAGEFPALLIWAAVACLLVIRANELITLFLALEILSLASYALTGLATRQSLGKEAVLKVFLMTAFVGGFLVYGIAIIYGRTGTTDLSVISSSTLGGDLLVILGVLLVVAVLFSRMAVVPLHSWAPDVFQGMPTPMASFLATAPIVALSIMVLRILTVSQSLDLARQWSQAMLFLSLSSMVLGHLLAWIQEDIKRMLAYACIGHMGSLLIPLIDLTSRSQEVVLAYLLAYGLMVAGAFIVVGLFYARGGEQHLIGELSGWGHRFPLLGLALTICLLSLAGIPPTAGFIGKSLVLLHAIEKGRGVLATAIVVTSVMQIVYTSRVLFVLYARQEAVEPSGLKIDVWGRLAALSAAGLTLIVGIFPTKLLQYLEGLMSSPL